VKLLIATRSPHKLREIREILSSVQGLVVMSPDDVGLPPAPEEDDLEPHASFDENARSKARYFHERTGLPTVADDSGLAVDALGGAPGVHSKRFAPVPEGTHGELRDAANNAHLLQLLEALPSARRTARYICVVALEGLGAALTFQGDAEGVIVREPQGQDGFGYDPLFLDPHSGQTFGQMSAAEKNSRSHRGAAFRALAQFLDRSSGEG